MKSFPCFVELKSRDGFKKSFIVIMLIMLVPSSHIHNINDGNQHVCVDMACYYNSTTKTISYSRNKCLVMECG
jgi:hypothetical protein